MKNKKGKYFAEYDEETASYCVFHTDIKTGFVYASYSTLQEAEQEANKRNEVI